MDVKAKLLTLLERVKEMASVRWNNIREAIEDALEYLEEICVLFEPCSGQGCLETIQKMFEEATAADAAATVAA